MTPRPSCLTCRHSEPCQLDTLTLECRRYPPTIIFHPDADEPFMAFPQVIEGDYCGEWAEEQETT